MTSLTNFCDSASDLWVMRRRGREAFCSGKAEAHFGAHFALIQVGDSQGEDSQRSAYEWWPLTINGRPVGELRDDASGMTIHAYPSAPRPCSRCGNLYDHRYPCVG